MDAYKQHKETENKVHEALYVNLSLLSGFYSTTKEFDAVFCKDMFVKNNKAAFFEVIYYLLNILNPEQTKKNLSNWPPYDVKSEAKCRSELIAYINTLNLTYENADIPVCQASSLISPGGFRFVKFMFKISQLVLYEHLKRLGHVDIICPLKRHRNSSIVGSAQKSNLVKEVKLIETETRDLLENFYQSFSGISKKGEQISMKLEELNKDICFAKKQLDDAQKEFNMKYSTYPSLLSLQEQLTTLKQQTDKIMELENLFSTTEQLLNYLSGSTMSLEHNEENFTVPGDVTHIITDRKELNLCEFFHGLTLLLEKKALQLQSPTTASMKQTRELLQNQVTKGQTILKHFELETDHINTILEDLREGVHGVTKQLCKLDLPACKI